MVENRRTSQQDGPAANLAGAAGAPAPAPRAGEPAPTPARRGRVRPRADLLLSALAAVLLTALVYAFVWQVLGATRVGELLLDRGWVPYATVYLTVWAGCLLGLKHLRLRRERRALGLDLLPAAIAERISPATAPAFRAHLAQVLGDPRRSLIGDRLDKALHHLETRRTGREVAEHLNRLSENDAAAVETSYTMLRALVWAIPILGFIGTVLGIGQAVGVFSEVVETSRELQQIKDSLGGVTTGLAVAFDTTLIALVLSVFVMFPMSSLQKREEELLDEVDEACDERLVRRLEGDESFDALPGLVRSALQQGLSEHAHSMAEWTASVADVGRTVADEVMQGWRRALELDRSNYEHTHGRSAKLLEETLGRSARMLEETQAASAGMIGTARTAFQEFAVAREREAERLAALLSEWQLQQQRAQRESAAALARMADVLARTQGSIERASQGGLQQLETAVESLAPRVERKVASIGDAVGREWSEHLARLGAVQEQVAQNLERMQASVSQLTQQAAGRLDGWSDEFRRAVSGTSKEVAADLAGSRAKLDGAMDLVREQVERTATLQADLLEEQRRAGRELIEALYRAGVRSDERAGEHAAALERTSEQILAAVAKRLDESLARSAEALDAARRTQETALAEITRRVGAALEQTQQQAVQQAEAVSALLDDHQRLATLQKSLAANYQVLARSESLSKTLRRLDQRLKELGEALVHIDARAGRNGRGVLGRLLSRKAP